MIISQAIEKAFEKMKDDKQPISLCSNCNCMTKTIENKCGKCGGEKQPKDNLDKEFDEKFELGFNNWKRKDILSFIRLREQRLKEQIKKELMKYKCGNHKRLIALISNL